jgi:3,4-dihydroxyphenylacetate 2,3-dioxygenase
MTGSTTSAPPPNIVRSSYATLVVTDLARARWFWVDLLGFSVTVEDDHSLYLRGYDELTHHNLVLRTGPQPALDHLAFRVASREELDRADRFFGQRGCPKRWVAKGATVGVGEALRVQDPLGFVVELFADIDHPERLCQRYDLRRGAEPARLDHFNIVVPDVPGAFGHYESLGFRCSETIEDDTTLYAAWMFRKQTVHDIAFTGGRGPRLHHLGFFAHESSHVLRICDILGSLHEEHFIERGPGRHGVSNAFYVYLRDPDGHRVELYTSDYYTGDPDHQVLRWDVRDPRRRDFWGGAVAPSWYEEASLVLDLDGVVQPVADIEQRSEVTVGADGIGLRSGDASPVAAAGGSRAR